MNGMLLFKTNLLIMSNHFLKKYLLVIFFHVFVHWEIWGYTYSRCRSKKKSMLRTRVFSLLNASVVHQAFLREKIGGKAWNYENKPANVKISNKWPTCLNGHLSIRNFTQTSCQRGTYFLYQQPHHRINENQRLYRKAEW